MPYHVEEEESTSSAAKGSKSEKLLREIRQNFKIAQDFWRDARDERAIDMRYVCGDPWDPRDRKVREDPEAPRPCISHDELNQYINQSVNDLRMNKRGIKVEPSDESTNDKTAELRQGLIRAIEYGSNAQSAYLTAAQAMYEGSYGFFRISRDYVSPDSFDQRIIIRTIPNPDSVLYDPNVKEPDWSDAKWCFVVEEMGIEEFKNKYPDAKVVNFTDEDRTVATDWILENSVMVAEYWKVESKPFWLYELEDGTVTRDKPAKWKRKRQSEDKQVWSYVTNGLDILEEKEEPEPGDQIPIPAVVGLVRYVKDEGGRVRRVLFSQVRLARDPQMSLAYLVSQEMEEAGLTPKTPYVGYVGQFETDANAWNTATMKPHARLMVDPMPDSASGQILPLPQRVPFTPNFQSYELAKDSCRRAIQAAMGISPLPTAAQRNNEKSGVALQRIQTAEQIGSFHFVDGYERALQRAGRIIDSWIPVVYDTERAEPIRKPDDTHQMVRLNSVDERGQQQHHIDEGKHNVTISVGPATESQRQAAEAFLDTLAANLPILMQLLGPDRAAKILALSIQMKQLGPKGDQISEIISPSNAPGANLPPQVQAMLGQAQQQNQQAQIVIQQLQAELQKLTQEKEGKVVEGEYKLQLEKLKGEFQVQLEKLKIEAEVAAAAAKTNIQAGAEGARMAADIYAKLHDQVHEASMAAADQAHERTMQAGDQAHEASLQADQQQHEQQLAQMQAEQAAQQGQEGQQESQGA